MERLTKAAEAGQDCAQYALGKIYRDGQGVEKDIQKAVALFTLAATKENSFAAFALGKLYLAGDAALPRDPAAAGLLPRPNRRTGMRNTPWLWSISQEKMHPKTA